MSEVVVITGATAGIGRAIVRRFARDGASIALVARNRVGLDAARREVEDAGGRALVLPTDVADHEAVDAAAQAAEEQLGPIDVWVNNAMTTFFGWFDDIAPEEYERATQVTYLGYVWGTRAALRRMVPRDRGTIVQVGSALAFQGIPLQSAYCGAKHAMKGMQESLRCELRAKGSNVHLTAVHLPGMNTPQFEHARTTMPKVPEPVPPVYEPEIAADAVHAAAHRRRREIWVGVPTIYTIWGNRLAPWLAEWYLARTGISGQQSDVPLGCDRRAGNLFATADHDEGAHGPYDDRAHAHSLQTTLATHRTATFSGVLAAGAAVLGARAAARR